MDPRVEIVRRDTGDVVYTSGFVANWPARAVMDLVAGMQLDLDHDNPGAYEARVVTSPTITITTGEGETA